MGLALTNIANSPQKQQKFVGLKKKMDAWERKTAEVPHRHSCANIILLEISDAYLGKNVSTKPLLGWPQAEGNPGQPKLHPGDQSLETGG